MRVTQKLLSNNLQYALQKNLNGIARAQEQISMGTKVNRPSDDPAGFSHTLALQSNLNLNGQYQRNITDGLGWLNQADAGLQKATDALQSARQLAVQGATGTLTEEDMRAVGRQIDAMTDELLEASNTSLGGKYIFAGLNNTSEPFHRANGDVFTFTGDDNDVMREIAPGARYPVNVNGKRFFYDKIVGVAKGTGSSVDQVTVDNGLQFGEYKVSTTDGTSAGDSKAEVSGYHTHANNTIVSNVGVSATNAFNSSILMEVTGVNYTQDQTEVVSSAPLALAPLTGSGSLGLSINGNSYTVTFAGTEDRNGVVNKINSVIGETGEASLDSANNLVLRSKTTGQESKIQITQVDNPALAGLNLSVGQSGAVGIADVTVKFTYHTYGKDGTLYDGNVTQTFSDTDPKDGDPDSPTNVTIGDGLGTHDIALNIDLTRFVEKGDKAVISVAAQAAAGDDSIGVSYDEKDRKYIFNDHAVDVGANLKFFTLDEGSGESYDGTISTTFSGGISDSPAAATFTAGNIFDCMVYLRNKLDYNQPDKVDRSLGYLSEKVDWLLQERVRVGARTNHLEAVDSQYQDFEVTISDMMKAYYSTDIPKATVELGEKQLTYQASLAAGAKIMQTSLLDYLR